jgi:DNA polymerase-3 subunit beta
VTEKGSVCLSASRFAAAIGALNSGEVEISADAKDIVTLRSGARRITLHGLKADEFPPLPIADNAPSFDTAAAPFGVALATCSPFASDDPTRYTICGVAMQRNKDRKQIVMVSTDGRCLRTHHIDTDAEAEIIIPTKAVNLLVALIDSMDAADTNIKVSHTESLIRVEAAEWSVTTKLIEGNYPNWRQVIPEEPKLSAVAAREAWLDALRVASVTTQADKDNDPRVKIEITKRSVDLISCCPDVGDSSIPVDEAKATGDLIVTFSSQYLRDGLNSFSGDEARFHLINDFSPLKIEDENGLFILMPFRTA